MKFEFCNDKRFSRSFRIRMHFTNIVLQGCTNTNQMIGKLILILTNKQHNDKCFVSIFFTPKNCNNASKRTNKSWTKTVVRFFCICQKRTSKREWVYMRMETERSNRIKLSERSSSRIGKIPTETKKIRPKRMYMANGSNLIPVSTKNKIKKNSQHAYHTHARTHTAQHKANISQYIRNAVWYSSIQW